MIELFKFHGVELTPHQNQHVGDCPFCGKVKHFFVADDGRFDCKRCQKQGNVYTFLRELWEASITTDEAYGKLAEIRGLRPDVFKHEGFRQSATTGNWLIPGYNANGKIANLWQRVKSKGKWLIYSTPGCKQHLFRGHTLKKHHNLVVICEGHWDTVAMVDCLFRTRSTKAKTWKEFLAAPIVSTIFSPENNRDVGVVGTPGTTFKDEWIPLIGERDVLVITDNDEPGVKLRDRIRHKLDRKVWTVFWNADDPKDLNDVVRL